MKQPAEHSSCSLHGYIVKPLLMHAQPGTLVEKLKIIASPLFTCLASLSSSAAVIASRS